MGRKGEKKKLRCSLRELATPAVYLATRIGRWKRGTTGPDALADGVGMWAVGVGCVVLAGLACWAGLAMLAI